MADALIVRAMYGAVLTTIGEMDVFVVFLARLEKF